MKEFLSWLATWGAAVFLVAVCVAWWEHQRRVALARRVRSWSDTEAEHPGTQVAALDFCLDTGIGAVPATGEVAVEGHEQTARRAVLDETLSRMARHKAEPIGRNAWADTQPLVLMTPAKPASAASKAALDKTRLTP